MLIVPICTCNHWRVNALEEYTLLIHDYTRINFNLQINSLFLKDVNCKPWSSLKKPTALVTMPNLKRLELQNIKFDDSLFVDLSEEASTIQVRYNETEFTH